MVTDTGDTTIHIQLDVEKLSSKEYTIDAGDIELVGSNGEYEYTFVPDELEVTVEGLGEDLDSLSSDDIKASADVSGMEAGEHQAVITFEELEHGYEIVEYTPMAVRVTADTQFVDPGEDLDTGSQAGSKTEEGDSQTEDETKRENVLLPRQQ